MRNVARGVRSWRPPTSDIWELALAQLGQRPITAVVSFLVALALPPGDRGRAAFVVGVGAIGASFVFGSLHVGAVLAVQARDRPAFRRVVATTVVLAGTCAVAAAAVATIRPHGHGLYTWESMTQVLVAWAVTVVLLVTTRTVQGLGHARLYRHLTLVNVALYAAGTIGCLYVAGWRDPLAVTLPWIGANAITAIASSAFTWWITRQTPWRTGGEKVTAVLASLSAHAGSAAQQLAYKADLFLLGWFATASGIGLYSLATSFAELVWVVPEVLVLSVFADPLVRHGEEWRDVAKRRIRQATVLSAGASITVAVVAAVVLLVALPDYRGSLLLLLLLLPGVVAASAARVTLSVFTARDERKALRHAALWMTCATTIYLPAIAWAGVTGAAAASSLVYLCQYLALRSLWLRRPEGPADRRPERETQG
jgi:O-antigen/teichoic acid export membrane protein